MTLTTPKETRGPVLDLCRELVQDPKPRFVEVTPVPGAEVNDCFVVVEQRVLDQGGRVRIGWEIWEWPGIMVEAEFHAVWEDPGGGLHDLTPKASRGVERILFLPDPIRAYEGKQVDNVRRAVSAHPAVRRLIEAAEGKFELQNRGERANQHGRLVLSAEEEREWRALEERSLAAYAETVAGQGRPGRNDPCPCNSGKKFKKCHGV